MIDANPKAATKLRHIAVARRKILEKRAMRAYSASHAVLRGPKSDNPNAETPIDSPRKLLLSDSAKRALADIAARTHDDVEHADDTRGNPQTTALYMKLCECYEDVRVSPSILQNADEHTAAWVKTTMESLRELVAAFHRRVTGEDFEATDHDSEREAIKLIGVAHKAGCCCFKGRGRLLEKSRDAFSILEDPDSLSLVRRGWLLRSFVTVLFMTNVWFQHTYGSVFTRFDPWSPRTQRITKLVGSLWASLFITSFFYAYSAGTPGQPLGPLTLSETIVLSLSESLTSRPASWCWVDIDAPTRCSVVRLRHAARLLLHVTCHSVRHSGVQVALSTAVG